MSSCLLCFKCFLRQTPHTTKLIKLKRFYYLNCLYIPCYNNILVKNVLQLKPLTIMGLAARGIWNSKEIPFFSFTTSFFFSIAWVRSYFHSTQHLIFKLCHSQSLKSQCPYEVTEMIYVMGEEDEKRINILVPDLQS